MYDLVHDDNHDQSGRLVESFSFRPAAMEGKGDGKQTEEAERTVSYYLLVIFMQQRLNDVLIYVFFQFLSLSPCTLKCFAL